MDFRIFGVIAQQRSGTHYLEGLLNAHPSIRSFGEVINARHSTYNFYRYLGQATAADPDVIRPHGWGPTWNTFVEELAGGKEGMIGVILMYNQLALLPPHFQEKVLARVHPIHLIRRNVLRTHVSDAINNLKQKPVHSKDIEGELIRIS